MPKHILFHSHYAGTYFPGWSSRMRMIVMVVVMTVMVVVIVMVVIMTMVVMMMGLYRRSRHQNPGAFFSATATASTAHDRFVLFLKLLPAP